ncbi:hypothetical protein [Streptomyces sp. NPDC059009]|uniref:hypothetical protein n=1 Tax=Streptomyces sp. NPDC059009 TaxID=3346694 RepID=UPI0036759B70
MMAADGPPPGPADEPSPGHTEPATEPAGPSDPPPPSPPAPPIPPVPPVPPVPPSPPTPPAEPIEPIEPAESAEPLKPADHPATPHHLAPAPAPTHSPTQALTLALLNLSGLGLGYVLLRCPPLAALCWAATGALLLLALPVDVNGVPGGVLIGYLAFLLLAAADAARRAGHAAGTDAAARNTRPPRLITLALSLALLAVPTGAALTYRAAQDEAVERMLLERLDRADRLLASAEGRPFDGPEASKYGQALALYLDLAGRHPGSRAAHRVPDRLAAYYRAVAAPYAEKRYCDAIEPLKHLRTLRLPRTMDRHHLSTLARWPDNRLATSLYACGTDALGTGTNENGTSDNYLGQLMRTFPHSAQAARVEPTLRTAIARRTAALDGAEPCRATDELRALRTTARGLPTRTAHRLARTAADAAREGHYACGIDEFKDGRFERATQTLRSFTAAHPHDRRAARAQDIAIAAEIATRRPQAGRRLPPARPPGGPRIDFTIKNDGPSPVEILYTGPVTGRLQLPACTGCRTYATSAEGSRKACGAGSGHTYPATTLHLPPGDYHFLHKRGAGPFGAIADHADGAELEPGYRYTDCTYVVTDVPASPL